jgi:DNA-binding NarL/FixJ family response regulator
MEEDQASMATVIEVENLHKSYGDTVAVDDVSFTVAEGQRPDRPGRDRGAPPWPDRRHPPAAGAGRGPRMDRLVKEQAGREGRPRNGQDGVPNRHDRTGQFDASAAGREVIRLLSADDHPVVRDGLSSMFSADPDFEVLGEAANGADAVALALALEPDVVLMDVRMPGMDGVSAIAELSRRGVAARVLVLTTFDSDSDVLPAIEAGATGYLLKDSPRAELFRAVRAAARGEAVLSPSVATRLLDQVRAPAQELLRQRENEVLEMVAPGSTNREAAAKLFISEATVKTHLLHIYAKLGVSDRAAAVAEAFDRGLLTPGTR